MIDSISRVFTPPTETTFGGDKGMVDAEAAIEQLGKNLEAVMKPIEPVIKLLNKK